MKQFLFLMLAATAVLSADAEGDAQAEQRRIDQQRIEDKIQRQKDEDARIEQRRQENARIQRKLDDEAWDRQHGR